MDPATPAPASPGPTYAVRLDLEAPNTIARWRPLVHWLLAFPHFVVAYALSVLIGAITFIAFFAILFTKKYPEGLFKFAVMVNRYNWRLWSYVMYVREPYPPFEFPTDLEDPGTDPARLSIDYPQELSRWLIFVKWILAIPHYFVLFLLFVGAVVVWLLSFFAVLVTGKYPSGMRNYMVGVARWTQRVNAYTYLLTDEYPPFSLQ
ncbi:MAG TPA: DUF4389 domain-containing protein [Actinomycetota bacterium]|nr:DUF4389 domain-containing protein [Actinomycetota bacterium]